jgi:hypothetical protein
MSLDGFPGVANLAFHGICGVPFAMHSLERSVGVESHFLLVNVRSAALVANIF